MYDFFPSHVLSSIQRSIKKHSLNVLERGNSRVVLANNHCQVAIICEYYYAYTLFRPDAKSEWVPGGSILAIQNGATKEEVLPKVSKAKSESSSGSNTDNVKSSIKNIGKLFDSGKYDSLFNGNFEGIDQLLNWLRQASDL